MTRSEADSRLLRWSSGNPNIDRRVDERLRRTLDRIHDEEIRAKLLLATRVQAAA